MAHECVQARRIRNNQWAFPPRRKVKCSDATRVGGVGKKPRTGTKTTSKSVMAWRAPAPCGAASRPGCAASKPGNAASKPGKAASRPTECVLVSAGGAPRTAEPDQRDFERENGFLEMDHDFMAATAEHDDLPVDDDLLEAGVAEESHDDADEDEGEGDETAAAAGPRLIAAFSRQLAFIFHGQQCQGTASAVELTDAGASTDAGERKFEYRLSLPLLYEVALPAALLKYGQEDESWGVPGVLCADVPIDLLREQLPRLARWASCFFLQRAPDEADVRLAKDGNFVELLFRGDQVRLAVDFSPPPAKRAD